MQLGAKEVVLPKVTALPSCMKATELTSAMRLMLIRHKSYSLAGTALWHQLGTSRAVA